MIQLVRSSDGTRAMSTLFDADSGAGTQWLEGVVMRMSASGGSVEVFRAEDSGHTSGDPGLMLFCVRNDAAAVLAGTTLDYIPCTTNAVGEILVALPAGAGATQVQGTANDGAAEVGNPVQIGGVDAGGLMQAVLVGTDGRFDVNLGQLAGTALAVPFDADTGAGTQNLQGVLLRRSGAGGSVEMGTSVEPVRTDPTGTTTQPVSGTVTANQGTANATPWNENLAQINGVAPLMGAGVTGTGSPRISIATDANTIQISQTTPATTNGVTPVPTSNAGAANALTSSGAVQASNVLKASAGNLYSLTITTGATAGFLMVFNATSAPIDGAVTPAYCSQAPANMTSAMEWSIPVRFGTGITAVFSTTGCFTKTESATAAFFAQVN